MMPYSEVNRRWEEVASTLDAVGRRHAGFAAQYGLLVEPWTWVRDESRPAECAAAAAIMAWRAGQEALEHRRRILIDRLATIERYRRVVLN